MVNSQTLLFKERDPAANAVGLTQLVYLLQKIEEIEDEVLEEKMYEETKFLIDSCTSRELKLDSLHLVLADLCDADLRYAHFKNAKLWYSICIDTDFRGAFFHGASFLGASLNFADFRGAKLIGANFKNAVLSDSKFHNADLKDAILDGADIQGADFAGAENLRKEQFTQAKTGKKQKKFPKT